MDHQAFEIHEISILCLHREIHSNTGKICQNAIHRASNIHKSTLYFYRVCLLIAYGISTIDVRDLYPTVEVHFGQPMHMGVNCLKREVFSLRHLDTWQQVYGLGRAWVKPLTAYACPKSRLFPDLPLYLKIHENIEKPRKMALDRLDILYICIHKPFRVRFHHIGTFPLYFFI